MYISPFSQNNNITEVEEFIHNNGFGILVSNQNDKLLATHIPLQLNKNEKGEQVLSGHIAKANPQWKNFSDEGEVLAIFSGPQAYISSSWYDHENVPTWNYIAVHIYGKIRIIEGEALLNSLKNLVNKYEAGSEKPVSVEEMSPETMNREIRGIVGFEINIREIQSAFKLSQNRDEKNLHLIINALEAKGDPASLGIAREMRKLKI